jgi:hypothetical protein
MPVFTISYRMFCNGSVAVEAKSLEEARLEVENLPLSKLGSEADDGEVEIVTDPPLPDMMRCKHCGLAVIETDGYKPGYPGKPSDYGTHFTAIHMSTVYVCKYPLLGEDDVTT